VFRAINTIRFHELGSSLFFICLHKVGKNGRHILRILPKKLKNVLFFKNNVLFFPNKSKTQKRGNCILFYFLNIFKSYLIQVYLLLRCYHLLERF
jgi:hypothetical protein